MASTISATSHRWHAAGYRAARESAGLPSKEVAARMAKILGPVRGLSRTRVSTWGDDDAPGAPAWTWAALESVLGSRAFVRRIKKGQR